MAPLRRALVTVVLRHVPLSLRRLIAATLVLFSYVECLLIAFRHRRRYLLI